jgi:tRNA threonylcarbamoyladenosine biosynthesis protein TsaE
VTLDEAGLIAWGRRIGRDAARPLFLALRGELGAGKSVLARAVADGAGVRATMPSPTYNLVFHYEADRGAVVHVDLFRLRGPEEVRELGWREFGAEGEIVIVEWPERAERILPADRWDIEIQPGPAPDLRRITATRRGDAPGLPPP